MTPETCAIPELGLLAKVVAGGILMLAAFGWGTLCFVIWQLYFDNFCRKVEIGETVLFSFFAVSIPVAALYVIVSS